MPSNLWHPGLDMVVYKLVNPVDYTIFYVGRTQKKLSVRLSLHFTETVYDASVRTDAVNKRKLLVMRDIKSKGFRPIISPIETFPIYSWSDFHAACNREKYWMCFYSQIGHPITNRIYTPDYRVSDTIILKP